MKSKSISLLFLALLSLGFMSCGPSTQKRDLQFSNSKTIIGDNDLEPVPKILNDKSDHSPSEELLDSIGKMELGCTATHIGHRLVITAGHCVTARLFDFHKNISCFRDFTINWGVRGSFEGYLQSKCKKIIAAENSMKRDFAIIEVDYAPKSKFTLSPYGEPRVNHLLTLYSHPMKRPLEWSKNCKNLGKKDLGPWSANREYHQNRIHYACDTEGGSSGAAVLDAENFEILAIHNSGITTPDDQNKATTVKDILDKLNLEGVELPLD